MPRIPKRTKRLNLALTEEVRDRMEEIRDETGALTLTEVISRSIAVYDFLWKRRKDGARLVVKDSEGEQELVLL